MYGYLKVNIIITFPIVSFIFKPCSSELPRINEVLSMRVVEQREMRRLKANYGM